MFNFFERMWKEIIAWFLLCFASLIVFILALAILKYTVLRKPVFVARLLLEPFILAFDLLMFFARRFHLLEMDNNDERIRGNMKIMPKVENLWQDFRS